MLFFCKNLQFQQWKNQWQIFKNGFKSIFMWCSIKKNKATKNICTSYGIKMQNLALAEKKPLVHVYGMLYQISLESNGVC